MMVIYNRACKISKIKARRMASLLAGLYSAPSLALPLAGVYGDTNCS